MLAKRYIDLVDHGEKPSAYAEKKTLSQEIGEEATCRTRRQHWSLTKGAEKDSEARPKNEPQCRDALGLSGPSWGT
jgi:hypothetical protein